MVDMQIEVVGSQRADVSAAKDDAAVTMNVRLGDGREAALTFPTLLNAEKFRVELEALMVSAISQMKAKAEHDRPEFVVPIRLRNVAVHPDYLGQSVAVSIDTQASYRTVWALDLEQVPQLAAALLAAYEKTKSTQLGQG